MAHSQRLLKPLLPFQTAFLLSSRHSTKYLLNLGYPAVFLYNATLFAPSLSPAEP